MEDLQPYMARETRILNGIHTMMAPFSLLYGNETVKETMDGKFTGRFIREAVFEEIIPTLIISEEKLISLAEEMSEGRNNSFIEHKLSNIALNSISKFEVRVLPWLLGFQKKYGRLPLRLTFSFACLMRLYKGTWKGQELLLNDEKKVISEFDVIWRLKCNEEISARVLQNRDFWKIDLTEVPQLKDMISRALDLVEIKGIEEGHEIFSQLDMLNK